MKPEMLEIVLQEILSEQKETNLINAQLAAYTKSLSDKINDLEKKIDQRKTLGAHSEPELSPELKNKLDVIKNAIEVEKSPIVYRKVFQFFPSQNIREYYQVYGNILKWIVLFGIACLAIRLIRDLLEKQDFL